MNIRTLDRFQSIRNTESESKTGHSLANKKADNRNSSVSKRLSESEIRAKIRDLETNNDDYKLEISTPKKEIPQETDLESEAPPVSDIGVNDPNSEVTQEKLRQVLRSNAFGFSDKERETLSSILGSG